MDSKQTSNRSVAWRVLLAAAMFGWGVIVGLLAAPFVESFRKLLSATPRPVANATSEVWSSLPLETGERVLQSGEQASWTWPAASGAVRLSLEARIGWNQLAGAAPIMGLTVNGAAISGEMLVNKPITFTLADRRSASYLEQFTQPSSRPPNWVLFYSPNFEANNVPGSGYQVMQGQAYLYVFDITRLVQPGRENQIVLSNRADRLTSPETRSVTLYLRQVRLLTK